MGSHSHTISSGSFCSIRGDVSSKATVKEFYQEIAAKEDHVSNLVAKAKESQVTRQSSDPSYY